MSTNKILKKTTLSKESLIYAAIFVVYVIITITIFVYSVKFLGAAINFSLSEPLSQTLEQKYGQVNLDNYSIIAAKLNFFKASPIVQNSAPSIPPIDYQSSTPETIVVSSTSPEISLIVDPQSTPTSSLIDIKPSIVVINSTLTAGLASSLKNKFQDASFEVLRIGNVRPSEVNTIIKVKANINQNSSDFSDIKKIVSESYDFIIGPLEDTSDHDIEVVIGEK